MTAQRRARGISGEDVAAAWYRSQGYEVVARNWRCRQGELDLVLRQGATVVFCEVKSRSTARFGTPAEAVTHDKRQRIRHLAARWIEDSSFRPAQIRFDVAAVLGEELEVIEGAF
jgi:putative endonuclease